MEFCNNTNFTLPKQSQRSISILQDGSRSLGLSWKEKSLSYNRRNTVIKWQRVSELQLRGGIEDNSKKFSYFSMKTYVVTPQRDGSNDRSQNMFLWRNMDNYP